MKRSRHLALAAAVATAVVGGTAAALPQSASAAPASAPVSTSMQAPYNGACGYGYTVVNSADIGQQGTVYLTYNAGNGYNCVATVRKTPGAAMYMFAYLEVLDGSNPRVDSGYYTTYAGPVYDYGRGTCVTWAGGIGNQEVWTYGSNCGALTATRVTKNNGHTVRTTVAEPKAAAGNAR
jgi:hypothetical protein